MKLFLCVRECVEGGGVRLEVGCPCSPVRSNIVTLHPLLILRMFILLSPDSTKLWRIYRLDLKTQIWIARKNVFTLFPHFVLLQMNWYHYHDVIRILDVSILISKLSLEWRKRERVQLTGLKLVFHLSVHAGHAFPKIWAGPTGKERARIGLFYHTFNHTFFPSKETEIATSKKTTTLLISQNISVDLKQLFSEHFSCGHATL